MSIQENPVTPVTHDPEVDAEPLPRPEAGFPELIQQLLDDLIAWITLEGDLARVEVTEKARAALRGLIIGATGLVVFLCGGLAILLAIGFAVSGLFEQAGVNPAFSHALGFLLSGLIGTFAGWAVIQQAKSILSPANLAPSRTTATLHRAFTWASAKLGLYRYNDHETKPPSA
jgi:hypothetical protein